MFRKFKLKIGHSKLRKLLKGLNRNKRVHNLDSARKIGILSYFINDNDFEQTIELMNFLSDKKLDVYVLSYYPGKEIPHKYLMRKNIHVFSKKDINWYGKPVMSYVNEFINKEFDILIDLCLQEFFTLRWIASLSKAKFKVGSLSYYGTPNDLIINIKNENNLQYFISHLKHYLYLINNRFAQEEEEKKKKFERE